MQSPGSLCRIVPQSIVEELPLAGHQEGSKEPVPKREARAVVFVMVLGCFTVVQLVLSKTDLASEAEVDAREAALRAQVGVSQL